jgi:hypothetical protein
MSTYWKSASLRRGSGKLLSGRRFPSRAAEKSGAGMSFTTVSTGCRPSHKPVSPATPAAARGRRPVVNPHASACGHRKLGGSHQENAHQSPRQRVGGQRRVAGLRPSSVSFRLFQTSAHVRRQRSRPRHVDANPAHARDRQARAPNGSPREGRLRRSSLACPGRSAAGGGNVIPQADLWATRATKRPGVMVELYIKHENVIKLICACRNPCARRRMRNCTTLSRSFI